MGGLVKKESMLIPKPSPPPIRIFVDETYLPDCSAFIQAGVVFTDQAYRDLVVPKCGELLRQLDPRTKEFKASKLAEGNKAAYEQFLERITSVEGAIAEKGACLRAVVTVDASAQYAGSNFRTIKETADLALSKLGFTQVPTCVDEFCRQILWLHYHLPKMIPHRLGNGIVVTFDEKHRYVQQVRRSWPIRSSAGTECLAQMGEILSSFANTMLTSVLPPASGPVRVEKFDFFPSHESPGLQAADLIANLMYNALRYENGFKDPKMKAKLKRDLLYEFIPEPISCQRLTTALKLSGGDITCVDPKLLLTMQINPNV